MPSLFIAAALFWPRRASSMHRRRLADAFDRRIVTLLVFGPALATARAEARHRPRHACDVGLSAVAVPRPVAGPVAPKPRSTARGSP